MKSKQTEIARGWIWIFGHKGKVHTMSVCKSNVEIDMDRIVSLKIPKRVRDDMLKRKYRVIVEPIEAKTKGKK